MIYCGMYVQNKAKIVMTAMAMLHSHSSDYWSLSFEARASASLQHARNTFTYIPISMGNYMTGIVAWVCR